MYVNHVCAWYPGRSEEGVRSPETGVISGCESYHVDAGTKPGFSVRKVNSRNCWASSPNPFWFWDGILFETDQAVLEFTTAQVNLELKILLCLRFTDAGVFRCVPPRLALRALSFCFILLQCYWWNPVPRARDHLSCSCGTSCSLTVLAEPSKTLFKW